jgi:presenilin 1
LPFIEAKSEETRQIDTAGAEGAVLNALYIVGFLAVATFVIVLCYKLKCYKWIECYLMATSTSLLGIFGSHLAYCLVTQTWLRKVLLIDVFVWGFLFWNFSVVGVVAIFFQLGIPRSCTHGYLVATSVLMAWQFSSLPAWTSWSLLVVLAWYDLCAVLTPCGPLKLLVDLMVQDEVQIPGLIFETGNDSRCLSCFLCRFSFFVDMLPP